MKLNELPISTEAKDHITFAYRHVNEIISKDELMPKILLTNSSSGQNYIIACPFRNDTEKDLFAGFIKKKVIELGIDLSVFTSESYTLSDKDADNYQNNREKYQNNMGNHPARRDVVIFAVETLSRQYMGMAEIITKEGTRYLNEIEFKETKQCEGRFVGFLPKLKVN